MATIKDVARVAEVSVATVSRVINHDKKVKEHTRERVMAAINALGYQLNINGRSLSTQKTSTIGLAIPDISDPFFAALSKGVDSVARKNGYQLLLSTAQNSAESEQQAIELLLQRRCDAIIVYATHLSNEQLTRFVKQHNHLVIIARYIPEVKEKCLWLNNHHGGKLAGEHFAKQDHQHIAAIMSDFAIEDPKARLNGLQLAAEQQNLNLPESSIAFANPTLLGGASAVNKLLATKTHFTALFVYNDAMAIGAINALFDAGLNVPEDVSVIGFDDISLAQYARPKLTTLHYPIEKIAKYATQLALDVITAGDICLEFLPHLVTRDSTRCYQ